MIVKKTKEEFQAIVERCESCSQAIMEFHKLVVPDFDKKEQLNGYVKCNRATAEILGMMLTKKFRSANTMFMIMNYMFSSLENKVSDWEFDISEV